MAIAAQEQGLLVKKAYPEADQEKCQKCPYFFKLFPWSPKAKNDNGEISFSGACLCEKKIDQNPKHSLRLCST